MSDLSLTDRLHALQQAIHAAAADKPVQLVAVSKTQPVAAIAALLAAGQLDFGENYVQELIGKHAELPAPPAQRWHLIGPLQSNKATLISPYLHWVHSVDRAKIVPLLASAREPQQHPLQVLIQVNLDDEGSKSGVNPEVEPILALGALITAQPTLSWRGLMTIPKAQTDEGAARAALARMRRLFESVRKHADIDTLSMGMSGDYLSAIEEGATMVRVGSALFGARG